MLFYFWNLTPRTIFYFWTKISLAKLTYFDLTSMWYNFVKTYSAPCICYAKLAKLPNTRILQNFAQFMKSIYLLLIPWKSTMFLEKLTKDLKSIHTHAENICTEPWLVHIGSRCPNLSDALTLTASDVTGKTMYSTCYRIKLQKTHFVSNNPTCFAILWSFGKSHYIMKDLVKFRQLLVAVGVLHQKIMTNLWQNVRYQVEFPL